MASLPVSADGVSLLAQPSERSAVSGTGWGCLVWNMEDSVSLCPVVQCVGFGDEPVFVVLPMATFAVYFSEILGGYRYRVPVLP